MEALEACEQALGALKEVLKALQGTLKVLGELPDVSVPEHSFAEASGRRIVDGEEELVRV